jgi:tetratricopeptide (TPR) repeat protein
MSVIPEDLPTIEKRLACNCDDLDALIELGALRFEPGHDPRTAEEVLRRAITLDPRNVDALFWLAKIRFHDYVDLEAAKMLLEEALQVNSQRADCLSLLASVLADLDDEPWHYVGYLERAVASEPQWPSLRHHYAQTLLKLGRLDDAELQAREGLAVLEGVTRQEVRDSYYEVAVTGRRWPQMREELVSLLAEIARRGRSLS